MKLKSKSLIGSRMSRSKTTDAFSDLLNPIKDPERSFAINISELLDNYVRSFLDGSVNFNSAALMIQGSSSIYGKKVEYLHNLATKLYASLQKNNKEDVVKKDAKEKEKHSKESKFTDPFCSTEIKLGKNLSCLRKKFAAKNAASKKVSKKTDKKYTYVPVDLIPLESKESSGREITDIDGKPIGKQAEFILNKSKLISSGWLLLPTTSIDLIPSQFSSSDCSFDDEDLDDNMCVDLDSQMPGSCPLDDGYPPSSGCTDTPTSVPSSQESMSVPSSQGTDEGLGSLPCTPQENGSQLETGTSVEGGSTSTANGPPTETPMESMQGPDALNHGVEGNENIPLEDSDQAPRPRRSPRQALKLCQLQEDGAPNQGEDASTPLEKEEVAAVKRAIQKNNTCNLPFKLKANDARKLVPASGFCARTFFSVDCNNHRHLYSMRVRSFRNNSRMYAKFRAIQSKLLAISQRRRDRAIAGAADENDFVENDDIDIGNAEIEANLDDPVKNDLVTPLEAADIVIENNPMLPIPVTDNENPLAEDEPILNEDEPMFAESIDDELSAYNDKELEDSFTNAARLQCDLFREDLQQYAQTSDISERVNAWEATMKPYLEGLSKREEFDINLYGSRILNAFEDSNRKQTITFRNFCKGKEKWEIHRYFMALLPLVNIGNVNIESQQLSEDEQDILVTLLSRKMHHKELEEFGHNEGEHS